MAKVDGNSFIFYKLIVPSIIQERKLRIPEKFVCKVGHELSAVVKLSVANDRIWLIGLAKDGNKLWFLRGWQEFVRHYCISAGYFLVFRYEGYSVFNVSIFNLITSQIDYHSEALNSKEESNQCNKSRLFEKMEDEDSVEVLGSASPYQVQGSLKMESRDEGVDRLTLGISYKSLAQQKLYDQYKFKNYITSSHEGNQNMLKGAETSQSAIQCNEEVGLQYNRNALRNSEDSNKELQRLERTMRKKRKIESNEQEPSASARKRPVTAEERERAFNAAKMFESVNPFCRVVLRPSYLYRGCIMYFPSYFTEKYLSGVSGFVKLQNSDGKQWSVRCRCRGGKAKLSLGWYDFSLENNLGEGDICVFELISINDVVLKVATFRVLEDAR